MNAKKISLFFLTTLTIWSVSFKAMKKAMSEEVASEQRSEVRQRPIYEMVADMEAKEAAKYESELFSGEIYNQIYRERYAFLVRKYKYYETHWDKLKVRFKKRELKSVSGWVKQKQLIGGNFDYTNTLDEIKQTIKDKFMTMRQKGLIISKDRYEMIKDKYTGHLGYDLTRVWGAEYLKKEIEKAREQEGYGVPDYVIVADNPNVINIELSVLTTHFPVASKLKQGEAFTDFKKIIGPPAGNPKDHPKILEMGYTDLGPSDRQMENIRQDTETGKYYIVDTEIKSFRLKDYYTSLRDYSFADYARKRFLYLNKPIGEEKKINITINLKKQEGLEEEEREVSEIMSKSSDE